MLKSIIDGLRLRIEAIEAHLKSIDSQMKNIKWVIAENLKIVEHSENLIMKLLKSVDQKIETSRKLVRKPIIKKPTNGSHE